MNPPVMSPQYRTVAAGGIAGAAMTIVAWGLSFAHVTLPPDVVEAFTFMITSGAAWLVHPANASADAPPTINVPAMAKPVETTNAA